MTSQLISFLSGTTQVGALVLGHQKKMLEYLNNSHTGVSFPTDRKGNPLQGDIAHFAELLDRARNPKFAFIENSKTFLSLSSQQAKDILKLHDFRSNLAHVQSTSWFVETAGLPRMATASLDAMKHLFNHCTQRIHLSNAQIQWMDRNLQHLKKVLAPPS